MDYFTLEALPARFGDCLLLHFGPADDPGLVLIDGGPPKVWRKSLQPRLAELQRARRNGFKIDLLMVSHIDDDHVVGILEFTNAWVTEKRAGKNWPFPVDEVWHNSFERISNRKDINAVTASVTASAGVETVTDVDLDAYGIEDSVEARDGLKVLASVAKGKALRDDLETLKLPTNTGFDGDLVRPRNGPSVPYELGPELKLHIAGPLAKQLEDLQKKFAEDLAPEDALAAYTDGSVPNLSSIAAIASYKGKTMLLTGDARGDFLRAGLKEEGLLDADGKLHVDIFKLPHHGSDRNIDIDFFQQITADHYVASADGTFGNPDRPTMEMLIDARGKDAEYVIHLTYDLAEIDARREKEWTEDRESELEKKATTKPNQKVRAEWNSATQGLKALFDEKKAAGYKFTVAWPAAAGQGARIDLIDPIPV